jgi:hypothetical protein
VDATPPAGDFAVHPASDAEAGPLCSICQTGIVGGESIGPCSSCGSTFHEECWKENGGCAVYGCAKMPQTVKDENPPFAPQSYWGQDEKICPHCSKMIKVAAVRCRFCGTTFDTAVPMSQRELREKQNAKPAHESLKKTSVTVFVCGIVPCLAPLTAVLGGIWFLRHRQNIRKLPATNQVFSYVGLIASLVCTALMVLVLVFHH